LIYAHTLSPHLKFVNSLQSLTEKSQHFTVGLQLFLKEIFAAKKSCANLYSETFLKKEIPMINPFFAFSGATKGIILMIIGIVLLLFSLAILVQWINYLLLILSIFLIIYGFFRTEYYKKLGRLFKK